MSPVKGTASSIVCAQYILSPVHLTPHSLAEYIHSGLLYSSPSNTYRSISALAASAHVFGIPTTVAPSQSDALRWVNTVLQRSASTVRVMLQPSDAVAVSKVFKKSACLQLLTVNHNSCQPTCQSKEFGQLSDVTNNESIVEALSVIVIRKCINKLCALASLTRI